MKHLLKMLGLAVVAMAAAACTDRVETQTGYGEILARVDSSPKVSLSLWQTKALPMRRFTCLRTTVL